MGTWYRTARRRAHLLGDLATWPLAAGEHLSHRIRGTAPTGTARYRLHRVLLPREVLRRVHGMTSTHERSFFDWYARRLFEGRGEIVDLGVWLGSTTVALARGLRKNPRPEATPYKVHAYDRFVWEDWMAAFAGGPLNRRFRPGDSFLAAFEERTERYRSRIRVYPGDLTKIGWIGRPIEFLLIDAMKSWDVAAAILRHFFPAILPGGYVVQQDFCHFWEAWVHPIHYRLREYLVPVYDVPISASLVFRLERPIPERLLKAPWGFGTFELDEIDRAFAWAMEIVSEEHRPAVAAAKVRYLGLAGHRETARRELEALRRLGFWFRAGLTDVEEEIAAGEKDHRHRSLSKLRTPVRFHLRRGPEPPRRPPRPAHPPEPPNRRR